MLGKKPGSSPEPFIKLPLRENLPARLYSALDSGLLPSDQFNSLMSLANETSRLPAGFLRYLKSSDQKGSKFK